MSMSGKEGAGNLGEAASFTSVLRQKLTGLSRGKPDVHRWEDFFWESSQPVIGLSVRADTVLYLWLQAGKQENSRGWDVLRMVSEPREAELSLGEQVRMRSVREGWQELPFALCLSGEEVLLYQTELPPNLMETEEKEAAHWELDARLTEAGLDADAYAMAVRRCGENSALDAGAVYDESAHTYWLAAAPRDKLQSYQDDFAEQELSLRGFAVLAPLGPAQTEQGADVTLNGQPGAAAESVQTVLSNRSGADTVPQGAQFVPALYLPALCAALAVRREEHQNPLGFLLCGRPLPVRRCRYRRLAVLTLLVTLTALSVWSFFDARAYFQVRADFREQKQEEALLHHDQKIMQMTKKLQAKVSQRDQRVAMLMEKSLPWYSVMVHLGRPELQTEGVWLQDILLRQDRKIEISGRAMSYAALSAFLQSFEQDRDFFTQGPVLEESSAEEKAIHFRMSVSL